MGVPVTYVAGRPSATPAAASLTAIAVARRATRRTLRPGTALPSQSTDGMRRMVAATSTGIAT